MSKLRLSLQARGNYSDVGHLGAGKGYLCFSLSQKPLNSRKFALPFGLAAGMLEMGGLSHLNAKGYLLKHYDPMLLKRGRINL